VKNHSLPYWRLSNFYFFYFASLGALMPYLGVYLQSNGYSAWHVGLVLAVVQGTKIIAPNIWGWIADKKGNRMGIIRLAAFMTLLVFSMTFLSTKLPFFIIIIFLFSFFWNAMLPQFEAVTFDYLAKQTELYGRTRLWGSVGFIIAIIGTGALMDEWGDDILILVVIGLLFFICLSTIFIANKSKNKSNANSFHIKEVLLQKHVIAFFVVCFLVQASHAPYYSLFSIYLTEQGFNNFMVGQIWSIGVVAEIALFLVMHHLSRRFSIRNILLISIVLTVIRWILIAWLVDNIVVLVIAQIFHAASFGAFHVVAIQLVNQYFVGQNQGRGQALYSSVGYGLGGMCGSLMAGYLWLTLSASWVFTIAALLSFLALLIAWVYVAKNNPLLSANAENDLNVI